MKAIALALTASVLLSSCKKEETSHDPLKDRDKLEETLKEGINGKITFADGSAAAGVVVSDGYNCTLTGADGSYKLPITANSTYVFYSIPANAEVETGGNHNLPVFYKRLSIGSTKTYNFQMKKQAVEKNFRLLAIGDPQVTDSKEIKRFVNETVADIKSYIGSKGKGMKTYAVTLGDIVGNKWELYPEMIPTMGSDKTDGIPVFQTIGNHDHEFPKANDLAATKTFESYVGPLNYSWNRGNVHIVSMDNVRHTAKASSDYDGGFQDWQYKWLQQDLSYVDKSKTVILCVHIPFKNEFNNEFHGGSGYHSEVLALLAQFGHACIIAGHTHNNVTKWDHSVSGKNIHEYVTGTACGAWWHGTICTDGAPNGYGVFEFDGATVSNHLYKATKYPENFQMRIYRCTDFPAFTSPKNGNNYNWGIKTEAGRAIVNAWNADGNWTFKVYEHGEELSDLRTNGTAYRDMWAKYYFYMTALITSTNYDGAYHHMYYYNIQKDDLNNGTSNDIKVVATDAYGNTFVQEGFTLMSDDSAGVYRN